VQLEFEDEATFFSLASEYLQAAMLLQNTKSTGIKVSHVIYYLIGHAAELFVKSVLCEQGVSIDELRNNFGHDLRKLTAELKKNYTSFNLNCDRIIALDTMYKYKHLEYRQRTEKTFPSADLLLEDVGRLSAFAFDEVAKLQKIEKSN